METKTLKRLTVLLKWLALWLLIGSQLSLAALNAVAQEPTAVPTPTVAPTWTPEPGATATAGVPIAPTQIVATATLPNNRLVDFRADDDEIAAGTCVQFSWVVRGDIDRVEFDVDDDDKDPLLVSTMDSREECPTEKTKYYLKVRWLDGSQTKSGVEVEITSDDDSDSSSSTSSSGGSGTSVAAPGAFIPVTPILITTTTPEPFRTPVPASGASVAAFQNVARPDGILSSVSALPETGFTAPAARSGLDSGLVGNLSIVVGISLACLALLVGVRRS